MYALQCEFLLLGLFSLCKRTLLILIPYEKVLLQPLLDGNISPPVHRWIGCCQSAKQCVKTEIYLSETVDDSTCHHVIMLDQANFAGSTTSFKLLIFWLSVSFVCTLLRSVSVHVSDRLREVPHRGDKSVCDGRGWKYLAQCLQEALLCEGSVILWRFFCFAPILWLSSFFFLSCNHETFFFLVDLTYFPVFHSLFSKVF